MGKNRDIPITEATERAIREAARSEPLKGSSRRVPEPPSTLLKVLVRTASRLPVIRFIETAAFENCWNTRIDLPHRITAELAGDVMGFAYR
jgi:hypothetical protein